MMRAVPAEGEPGWQATSESAGKSLRPKQFCGDAELAWRTHLCDGST